MTCILTLRDGSRHTIEGLTMSQAKFLRKSGGSITVTAGDKEMHILGKNIKQIDPIYSQHSV